MRKHFLRVLVVLEEFFRCLEQRVPAPIWEPYQGQRRARYREQSLEQALLLKLARQISGLHALDALLLQGLQQEQGIIERVLDELGEDIQFLAHPLTGGELTERHKQYLNDFWSEEFDDPDPLRATQKRTPVRREKIFAHNARAITPDDPHTTKLIKETLHKTYSGFVHAASTHIMDMFEGEPPQVCFKVPPRDTRNRALVLNAWNYFYRALLAAAVVAIALRDFELVDRVYAAIAEFEEATNVRPLDPRSPRSHA